MHILETPLTWLKFQISSCQKATVMLSRVDTDAKDGYSNVNVVKTRIGEKYIWCSLDKQETGMS